MANKTFYITTPIFYPNGVPHIGHAYTALASDVLARFYRLDGRDVFFLTGTDEHGLKMQQTALQEGTTPLELATRNAEVFKKLWQTLNISVDDFIRTTEPRHHRASAEIWSRMEANGDIYLDTYAGWYSVRQEAYFDEKETSVGDDGVRREPLGSPVEWVEEESYFFKLSEYGDRLLAHYDTFPDFVAPRERRNEVISFVKSGLKDISVSRTTFDWGVKVPGNDKHVMYVWVDALTNYLTATGFPQEGGDRQKFWPADLHLIGKDIVRFHAVYWPAFLMSAGIELPKRVFAHGFLFNRGEKMSKSVGNVVDPFAMAEEYGVDGMRYYFLAEVSFGQDGSYSHETIANRINADLANDLGNLAQRSLSMIAKHCDARVPAPGAFSDADRKILAAADGLAEVCRTHFDVQAIHLALGAIWRVVGDGNRYFAGQEPWALRKTDPARMATVLFVTAEVLRQVSLLVQPVMPSSGAHLLDLLGVSADQRTFAALGPHGRLEPGTDLPPPVPVFPRYEPKKTNDTE
ncbi:MAG: methionine--tRNA ligase [Alphaproteobacteria bacterium]|nr:methionine--tRNA ligase [Alphaproteobacteria bacterium]